MGHFLFQFWVLLPVNIKYTDLLLRQMPDINNNSICLYIWSTTAQQPTIAPSNTMVTARENLQQQLQQSIQQQQQSQPSPQYRPPNQPPQPATTPNVTVTNPQAAAVSQAIQPQPSLLQQQQQTPPPPYPQTTVPGLMATIPGYMNTATAPSTSAPRQVNPLGGGLDGNVVVAGNMLNPGSNPVPSANQATTTAAGAAPKKGLSLTVSTCCM